jgi:hypothetical protein
MAGVQRSRTGLLGNGGVIDVRDEKPTGTSSGTFTTGAWRTRTLNTTATNTISGASLASDQITLPAGTYFVTAYAPAFLVAHHKARLYNITDSATVILGQNAWCSTSTAANTYDQTISIVTGIFTLAASKVLELQHNCGTTRATNGFGTDTNPAGATAEVYAQVTIFKLS